MRFINRIMQHFMQRRPATRLARIVEADRVRSSGAFSWTPAELRAMAKAETRARSQANILAKIGGA